MKRLWAFASGLGAVLIALAILISWYILDFEAGSTTTSGMMGQMMGGQYSGVAKPMPAYIWVSMIALIAVLAVCVIGAMYYFTYPEIKKAADHMEVEKSLPKSDAVGTPPHSALSGNSASPSKEAGRCSCAHPSRRKSGY